MPPSLPAAATLQAQGAMQQQMADKLAAVLEHFIHEVRLGLATWCSSLQPLVPNA